MPVKRFIVITAFAIVASFTIGGGSALAYPQFQLSRDQTCSSCHLSPAGGGLLSENGSVFAENSSQYGQNGAFFYDKFKLPSWLTLGGDVRSAYGYVRTPQQYLVGFPMQLDVYGSAKLAKHFGSRSPLAIAHPRSATKPRRTCGRASTTSRGRKTRMA